MTIQAQRLNQACKGLWSVGAIVSAGPSQKRAVTITDDGSCGAYLAWADSRPEAEACTLIARARPSTGRRPVDPRSARGWGKCKQSSCSVLKAQARTWHGLMGVAWKVCH
jgi:hypothetical protein